MRVLFNPFTGKFDLSDDAFIPIGGTKATKPVTGDVVFNDTKGISWNSTNYIKNNAGELDLVGTSIKIKSNVNNSAIINSTGLSATVDTISLITPGAFIVNAVVGGIKYNADYSGSYTIRSLVDKNYVDTAIGAINVDYPQVNTYADLPTASAHIGHIHIVLTATGNAFIFNRKEAGMYYSNGTTWNYLGDLPNAFSSSVFRVYDAVDNTKQVTFNVASISTSTSRQIIIPDADVDLTNIYQAASGSNNGYLSSTNWTTFNNKFTLPALTSGSVLFSNGTTIVQNNNNLYWSTANTALNVGTGGDQTGTDIINIYNNADSYAPNSANSAGTITSAAWTVSTSRGTGTVPLESIDGDFIGSFGAWGYNGSAYVPQTSIRTYVKGTTVNNRGGKLEIWTKADGGVMAKAIAVDNTQNTTYSGHIYPNAANTYDLGQNSNTGDWRKGYIRNIAPADAIGANVAGTQLFLDAGLGTGTGVISTNVPATVVIRSPIFGATGSASQILATRLMIGANPIVPNSATQMALWFGSATISSANMNMVYDGSAIYWGANSHNFRALGAGGGSWLSVGSLIATLGSSTILGVQAGFWTGVSTSSVYRLTNGGSNVTAHAMIDPAGTVSTAGALGYAFDTANGMSFTHANGTLRIRGWSAILTNLVNTAGSESSNITWTPQNVTDKFIIGGVFNLNQLTGVTSRMAEVDSLGNVTATEDITNLFISDATIITQLTTGGNWTGVTYTGTAIVGATQGQLYNNGTYFYVMVDNTTPIRCTRT